MHLGTTRLFTNFMSASADFGRLYCISYPLCVLPALCSSQVLYLPEQYSDLELRVRIRANYLMALNMPLYHGMPHLPLLVTGDDIVFAPDFNARLARVMQQVIHMHDQTSTAAAGLDLGPAAGALNAWVVSLYTGGEIEPVDEARAKRMAKGRNHTRWQNLALRPRA